MNAKKQIKTFLFLVSFLSVLPSHGRVFMFDQESVAPFINLRTGVSSMGNSPYRWQSASSYSGDEVDLVYGGEFGLYLRTGRVGLSLGVLVHTFDPVAGGKGQNASGTELFSVDVEGLSYGPQIVFDYQFAKTDIYLWKILLGGGYQFAELESTYSLSAAGQVLVGGANTFIESYKQEAPFAMLAFSTEFVMSGTTTVSVTAGYHYSFSKEWSYGQGGQNFAGSHGQGGKLLFEDSSVKTIDWSYPFLQLGFQFYVDTVR